MTNLKLKEVKQFSQGHRAKKKPGESLFFISFQNLRKLVYSVLIEGNVKRNEGNLYFSSIF